VPLLRWRGRPVLAWLYRVAANMAADELKRAARETPLPEVELAAPETDQADAVAEREALTKALRALPADYQLVVHLRLVEGYRFEEVARMTGRSVGACQMQLLRAGRLLRRSLEQEGIRAPA
jgi:RNA polymerase sigma-70 factor, ECF subfamily